MRVRESGNREVPLEGFNRRRRPARSRDRCLKPTRRSFRPHLHAAVAVHRFGLAAMQHRETRATPKWTRASYKSQSQQQRLREREMDLKSEIGKAKEKNRQILFSLFDRLHKKINDGRLGPPLAFMGFKSSRPPWSGNYP